MSDAEDGPRETDAALARLYDETWGAVYQANRITHPGGFTGADEMAQRAAMRAVYNAGLAAPRAALREAMEVLAIQVHMDRADSHPEDREPPGPYEYEGKAWWELPEAAKDDCRRLVARVHPTWVAAALPLGAPHR